jgi:hypothetical protein
MGNNQKGFSVLIIVIIILTASLVGGVGYYVYQTRTDNQESKAQPNVDNHNGVPDWGTGGDIDKPAIYLYPTRTQEVKVRLDYGGTLVSTYPDYDKSLKGWDVAASPDGTLINKADNKEYSYIFWEGEGATNQYDLTKGFVVKGSDTKIFLQSTLSQLGLVPKEYNEMIVYWLPKMEHNKYNLIHFAGSEYTDEAKLTITPTPDSLLRVFMVFKPLEKYQKIQPQDIKPFERNGFTVVEWGGTQI